MKLTNQEQKSGVESNFFGFRNVIFPILSLVALGIVFLAAISNLDLEIKLIIFFSAVVFYLLFFIALAVLQKKTKVTAISSKKPEEFFNREVESQLLALEDAGKFFGASLRTADMFRLSSSRVREIVPHSSSVLLLVDEFDANLKIIGASGMNSREMLAVGQVAPKGLAGICANLRKIKRDEKLTLEKSILPYDVLKYLETAVAVPLFENGDKVFAVLMLYGRHMEEFDDNAINILEAVGERVAPLILNALAFERNLFNALTDTLTSLPNERAFFLILENQIAESQRKREERPLSLLSIDISDFNELNQQYGHATGDKILAFTADIIKRQLRKMDFLARSGNDEFLAVLPTANENTTLEIIERLERTFQTAPFEISEGKKQFLKLNIGAAIVFKHGDTAAELLQNARLKKITAKAGHEAKIIWFPKEFIN